MKINRIFPPLFLFLVFVFSCAEKSDSILQEFKTYSIIVEGTPQEVDLSGLEEFVEEVVEEMIKEEVIDPEVIGEEKIEEVVEEVVEEVTVDPVEEEVTEEVIEEIVEEVVEEISKEDLIITSKTPCSFNELGIVAGQEAEISCLIDLNGQTVTVPNGVTLTFDGGDIFNGTLNFGDNGQIDGELLNSKLSISGDARLTSDEFQFYPSRWGITKAATTNASNTSQVQAFANHINIQKSIDLTKKLGAVDFEIGEMDAFFDSDNIFEGCITLPSDFNLKMSDSTILRVFPVNKTYSSKMIKAFNVDNVTISGGRVIGDRLIHGPTEGNNTLVDIVGARNVLVENMHLSLGFTGLTVYSLSWFDFPDQASRPYIPSEDIVIRNNTFQSNQSNNLSVTDGYRVLIEGNKVYDSGDDLEGAYGISRGLAPRIGIVIEPAFDGAGFTQRIEDVEIFNNIVEGSKTNAILALGAFRVDISGNTADGAVGWTSARFVTVTNNTVNGAGINGGFTGAESIGNTIANNTINDAATGIYLTSGDIDVYGNTINNSAIGIMMASLVNSKVHDNVITNSLSSDTWGINSQFFVNDVEVYDNSVTLTNGFPMFFIGINGEADHKGYQVNVNNNYFNSNKNMLVTNSDGINLDNNNFENVGINFGGSSNGSITNNTIVSKTETGLNINRAAGSVQDILVEGNTISNTSGKRLEGYAIRVNTVGSSFITENSNIEITGNTISSIGENYGIHSSNFDGLTISNNIISNESIYFHPLSFEGNNSVIKDNTFNNGVKDADIKGSNNTVSGNINN